MKTIRLVALLVFAVIAWRAVIVAQVVPNPLSSKPLPTLKQCQADREAWTAIAPSSDDKATFTYDDFTEMVLGMSQCDSVVDPDNRSKYAAVMDAIFRSVSGRYFDFLRRHPELWQQFEKEDRAGER
jgi:hypothetical protein